MRGKLFFLFLVLFVTMGFVSAESDYCCEKTIAGNWCQNDLESSCDNSYRKAPISCETTSYCNVGTCTDAQGVCVENAPKVLCENQNGIWEDKISCEEEQSFCTDTDGGIVFGVEGKTSKNGVTKIDSCDDADGDGIKERLLEYYCGDSLYPSALLGICSGECSDGVCYGEVDEYECNDSDGNDIYVKGLASSTSGQKGADCCSESLGGECSEVGDYVWENTCTGVGEQIIGNNYLCPNGCSDGACIKEEKIIDEVEELYCCERTMDGAFCQTSSIDRCDVNFRKAQTSCEKTSYCVSGI